LPPNERVRHNYAQTALWSRRDNDHLLFVAMFILMYSMVDRFANVYPNVNQFYMAGLMAAPMDEAMTMVFRVKDPAMLKQVKSR
jgi:hypothetical protein